MISEKEVLVAIRIQREFRGLEKISLRCKLIGRSKNNHIEFEGEWLGAIIKGDWVMKPLEQPFRTISINP